MSLHYGPLMIRRQIEKFSSVGMHLRSSEKPFQMVHKAVKVFLALELLCLLLSLLPTPNYAVHILVLMCSIL